MIAGVDPTTRFSLRKEPTPRLAVLDTFRCGVLSTIQEAERGESVWLEVIGPYCRSPELYPGGPRGHLTGSFSKQVHGAFFDPEGLLRSWESLRVRAFWYTLMGVDRTPYLSGIRLTRGTEMLRKDPLALVDRSIRRWLMDAGCLNQGCVNDRWDIVREIFNHSTKKTKRFLKEVTT